MNTLNNEQTTVGIDRFQPTLGKLVFPLVAIVIVLVISYSVKFYFYNDSNQVAWGVFGDYFGGVAGPIIGVFTVWGAWYAYVAQREANLIAINQFKEQNKITTFFELMNLYQTKVSSISFDSENGRNAIRELLDQYRRRYNISLMELIKVELCKHGINNSYGSYQCDVFRSVEISGFGELELIDNDSTNNEIHEMLMGADFELRQKLVNFYFEKAKIKSINDLILAFSSTLSDDDVYKLFLKIDESMYFDFGNEMGHYFRNIAQILLYISGCESKEDEFRRIFRAQFSRFEIAFLAYNCLSTRTSLRFNKLVMKYDMFDDFFPGDTIFEMNGVFRYLLRNKNRNLLHASRDA